MCISLFASTKNCETNKKILFEIKINEYFNFKVHRDIKPANILLMSNERETIAKLSDFGVAKYVYASSRYLNTTIAGRQQFMAPEVQFQTGHSTNADVRIG